MGLGHVLYDYPVGEMTTIAEIFPEHSNVG